MSPDQFTDTPWPRTERGGMLKLADAAKLANVQPRLLQRACELRQIPVTIEQLGRIYMVRAEEFYAWLQPSAPRGAPLRPDAVVNDRPLHV